MSAPSHSLFGTLQDKSALERTISRFAERRILLPTFAQLADPATIPESITEKLAHIGADDPHPLNLWRVHWYNDRERTQRVTVPQYLRLPRELTGVDATILVALGNCFPMIRAHKVLAAYACLAPRVVTGGFDPTRHRAIWPSTGNYARGGVAISRIMGCRGVAVLPEGMSRERFEWLEAWIADAQDVIRTYGTESNVKEIYDACNELARDERNVILNQFSEFSNHLGHYAVTGPALAHIVDHAGAGTLRAFVAASGSAGTLGAGDYLKQHYGARIVPVEALECPTMLYNGFGEHNIQGIGDKHIPLIHNVMNSDDVVAISDSASDSLLLLFNSENGKRRLRACGVDEALVDDLRHLGLSSIANVLAAIKIARYHDYGADDVIVTVATDGSEMYYSEMEKILDRDHAGEFDEQAAAAVHARYLQGVTTEHVLELNAIDRRRIFNLGYYTWVEQQNVAINDFEQRRSQSWWDGLRGYTSRWDEMIAEFNQRTGVSVN